MTLVRSDVSSEVAQELVSRASAARADLREAVRQQVLSAIRTVTWPAAQEERRMAAFVGPPGGGKTTTLAKIAARYGLTARKKVHVVTIDNHRIAAAEQLRVLCTILNVGFESVETAAGLDHAIHERRAADLILIDTPGLCDCDADEFETLAEIFRERPDIETHLVLPATMKRCDLACASDRFAAFGPARLLFTRLDETRTVGGILTETVRTGLPLSFIGKGQRIPDDLAAADSALIAAWILADQAGPARARRVAA